MDSSSLREEIVASQQARIDLLKYKLVAIATLGAVGLGFSETEIKSTDLVFQPVFVLCIIPFVCAFIDLLCLHNTIRILIIARYLVAHNDPYESFIVSIGERFEKLPKIKRKDGATIFFELEDWALQWSSLLLSLLLFGYGCYLIYDGRTGRGGMFSIVGIIGIYLSLQMWFSFRRRVTILFKVTGEAIPVR
jgi:hypothetical protein